MGGKREEGDRQAAPAPVPEEPAAPVAEGDVSDLEGAEQESALDAEAAVSETVIVGRLDSLDLRVASCEEATRNLKAGHNSARQRFDAAARTIADMYARLEQLVVRVEELALQLERRQLVAAPAAAPAPPVPAPATAPARVFTGGGRPHRVLTEAGITWSGGGNAPAPAGPSTRRPAPQPTGAGKGKRRILTTAGIESVTDANYRARLAELAKE